MMEEMATDEFIVEHAITNGGQKKQACYASFRKIQHKITDAGTAESSTMITSSSSTITTTTNSNNNGSRKRAYNSLEQEAGEEEEEDDQEITIPSMPSAPKMPARGARITIEVGQKKQTCYAAYRKIQHNGTGKATAERGLMHDFKHELHYVLSTLFDEKSSVNLKSLSLSQLLRKSTSYEFREFLRSQSTHLNKLFVVLAELVTSSPVISLSTACLLFFMARDRKGVPLSEQVIRLLSEQLKQQPDQQQRMKADDEYTKHHKLIWSIVLDWLRNVQCRKIPNSQFKFDMFTEQQLSVPYLTLEALCYMAIKEHSQLFKTEMLSSGCLSSVVAKLDKVVLELLLSPQPKETGTRLKMVERCYRILENAAAFNAKNQTFLIQHRNNLLIFSSAKFFNFALKFAEDANSSSSSASEDKQQSTAKSTKTTEASSSSSQQQAECNKLYDCICLVCRVLMNVSHDNENAALKIGQVAGFLANCLYLLAQHFKYAPREKHFDLAVMMYGLLVNLLERCAANRRKFISLKSNFFETDGSVANEVSSLEILAKLFVRHDSAAKTVDEELDNDLAVEEPEEGNGGEGNGGGNGLHQQERAANVSQDEVVSAIQNLMSKASTHMEDSMIASYCALVVAILVGTDHNLAGQITAILPDNDMSPMLEQLERFLEFMRITKMKAITVNNIERVLRSFQMASSANSSSTS